MISEPRRNLLAYTISTILLLLVGITFVAVQPQLRSVGVVSSVTGIAAWLVIRYRSGRDISVPLAAFLLFGLLLLQYVLSTNSPISIIAFEKVNTYLPLLIALLFVLDSLGSWWKADTWENSLLNFAILFSILELMLAAFWFVGWWQASGRILSVPPRGYRLSGLFLGHANVLSGYLNLVIPIALVRLIGSASRSRRLLWGAALGLFVATQYFASSRGGWLSGLAGVATVLGLIYFARLKDETERGIIVSNLRGQWIWVVAGAISFVLVSWAFVEQASSSPGHAPVATSRANIWLPAWSIIQGSPLVGAGPASFSLKLAELTQIPPGFATSHAHNIFLQTLAETGIVGLLILLAAALLVGRALVRSWRSKQPEDRLRLAAYAGAGIAFVAQHQVDYLLESPAYFFSVLVIVALIYHHAPRTEGIRVSRRFGTAAILLLVIPYIGINVWSGRGALQFWDGISAGRQGRWTAAAIDLCDAMEVNPENPFHAFQCGLASAYAARTDAGYNQLVEAKVAFHRGLEDEPVWPLHWGNAASLEWALGERDLALVDMRRASSSAPRNAELALNLGWMYEQLERLEPAQESYRLAIELDPSLSLSAFVLRSAIWTDLPPPAADPAIEGWQFLVSEDYGSSIRSFDQALEKNPSDGGSHAGLARALLKFGRAGEAATHASISGFLAPGSQESLGAAAQIYQRDGQDALAAEVLQRMADDLLTHGDSWSYYSRTYLRYYLSTDVVPQFLRGELSQIAAEDLTWLISYYERDQEPELALSIRRSLEIGGGSG